ncbi:unnamed protein product [Urochloa humidicola]
MKQLRVGWRCGARLARMRMSAGPSEECKGRSGREPGHGVRHRRLSYGGAGSGRHEPSAQRRRGSSARGQRRIRAAARQRTTGFWRRRREASRQKLLAWRRKQRHRAKRGGEREVAIPQIHLWRGTGETDVVPADRNLAWLTLGTWAALDDGGGSGRPCPCTARPWFRVA